jgi:hypothetical protein
MSVSCSARSSRESNRVEGYRGAYLLRREIPEGAEFVTLTLFDSMDAVRRFAGFVRSATVSEVAGLIRLARAARLWPSAW